MIISGRSMPEQHLKALSATGRFTPLIAKLGFSPDGVLPSREGLLTLSPIIRKVPADTD